MERQQRFKLESVLPSGTPLHDDLVISAALCVALERMRWGRGESAVVEAQDPFGEMREIF